MYKCTLSTAVALYLCVVNTFVSAVKIKVKFSHFEWGSRSKYYI